MIDFPAFTERKNSIRKQPANAPVIGLPVAFSYMNYSIDMASIIN